MIRMLMFVALLVAASEAQEANFGKKVKCFLVDGTVVCPGCNSRAGLLCPRNNMQTCDTNELPYTPKEQPTTEIPEDKRKPPPTEETEFYKPPNKVPPFNPDIPEDEVAFWAKLARENIEFRMFLYRILHYRRPVAPRYRRDVKQKPLVGSDNRDVEQEPLVDINDRDPQRNPVEDGDICEWNEDCPCPLICCKTGDGCPKRCRKGIKLPPPWGK